MQSPRSEEEALDQCELVWARLAETGEGYEGKYDAVADILGYMPRSGCPACEWDETAVGSENVDGYCSMCPIDAWRGSSEDGPPCCGDDSPYGIWVDSDDEEERKGLALGILGLIRDSKESRRSKE